MPDPASNIELIEGNLLHARADFIVHACNVVTEEAEGLAKQVFRRFPEADSYRGTSTARRTGTAEVIEVTTDPDRDGPRYVANLYAQFYPGKPKGNDSPGKRMMWFKKALLDLENKIACQIMKKTPCNRHRKDAVRIAFPYKIGCGLAKGRWEEYLDAIDEFAKRAGRSIGAEIVIERGYIRGLGHSHHG